MKQVLLKQGQIILDDVPAPTVGSGQVLVEVAHSVISAGTEISTVSSEQGNFWVRALKQPEALIRTLKMVQTQGLRRTWMMVEGIRQQEKPLGYSCSGRVLQVDENVRDIVPGDLVACGGAAQAHHAELVSVPRNLTVKVPTGLDLRKACLATVGAIALQGVRRAEPQLGERIAVIGLGLLGQLTVQLLKANGCHVLVSDLDSARRERAKHVGADVLVDPASDDIVKKVMAYSEGHGADAVIVTAASNHPSVLQQCMELTRRKGRVVLVGAVPIQFDRSPFYQKELDFLISCSYGPGRYDAEYEERGLDYPRAYVRWTENRNMQSFLELAQQGKVKLEDVIDREYAVEDVLKAYDDLSREGERPLGVVLNFPAANRTAAKPQWESEISLRKAAAASNSGTVGLALIGAGYFAQSMHMPNMTLLPDLYSLKAVVSKRGTAAKNLATQFRADLASTDPAEALKRQDVDAVLICTRHDDHASLSAQALKAGKAVLCEKPMALTHDEILSLESVAAKCKMPLMIGFNRRFSPAAQAMKVNLNRRSTPLMMMCRIAAGFIPLDHWTQGQEGGGRMIGEGCHWLDLMQFFVGDEVEVVSVDVSAISPTGRGVWWGRDNLTASVTYADGSVGTLIYCAMAAKGMPKEHIEAHWDGHTAIINDFKSAKLYDVKGNGQSLWQSSKQDKGHLEELRQFAKAIKSGGECPIPWSSQRRTSWLAITIDQMVRGQS